MITDSILRRHLPGILLIAALAISLIFFAVFPPDRVRRTLFFPGTTSVTLRGEQRLLPRADRVRSVEIVVEDLILGPADIANGRLLPRGTRINSLFIRDDIVYLDLSAISFIDDSSVRLDLSAALDGLEETILFNFRRLDDVVITLDGSVPFVPSYRAGSIGN